jgi:uncharacterized protein (DUF924 family)
LPAKPYLLAVRRPPPAAVGKRKGGGWRMPDEWVDDVHRFWFGALRPRDWFRTDAKLDAEIRRRFLWLWAGLKAAPPVLRDARTAVAAAVVFDQFPRNLFRGTPEAYATDPLALEVARAAIDLGLDHGLPDPERQFLYMPLQHSEDRGDQQRSVELFASLAVPNARRTAEAHKALIDRFGRFPHRNAVLGRESTPEETEHLRTTRAGFEK